VWFLKRVVVVMVGRENGCGGFGFWGYVAIEKRRVEEFETSFHGGRW